MSRSWIAVLYFRRDEVSVFAVPALNPSFVSDPSSNEAILDGFLEWLVDSGIEPYDHQEEAILELFQGRNV
ncbi:MAG: hypothetical protein ACPGAP_11195, partial [Akkermansiaceae bacterium]